jgi:release factor glutamine methyltransferase
MKTIEQALAWAWQTLAGADASEPLDATILLAFALNVDRAVLLAFPERAITAEQARRYRDLITRRAAGEPVPYLTGTRGFYDLDFYVTPDVLIPRPETEHLIEAALAWGRDRAGLRIADVGTGSGAIAVTLARHLPGSHVWAVDVSTAALDVARHNASQHGVVDQIVFVQGDLLEPAISAGQRFDLIAANLPYIPSAELDTLDVVKHEPRLALDGGADGLDAIRRLLDQAPGVLADAGLVLLEIAAGQGARVAVLSRAVFPGAMVNVIPDLAGHGRVVQIAS